MLAAFLWAYVLFLHFLSVKAQCHNRCSGHGTCDKQGRCACYESYTVRKENTFGSEAPVLAPWLRGGWPINLLLVLLVAVAIIQDERAGVGCGLPPPLRLALTPHCS